MMSLIQKVRLIIPIVFLPLIVFSQSPERYTSSEIYLRLKKLNVLGSVLYVAAHPDDENTKLISWLANEKLVNTGYLSVTRGDGGQNLIGPEIGQNLGVIRTQELLQARKIDRGQQFFTTAIDFGFSKNPEETFNIWDKERVLSDMVWVIRNTKPDIIITRFSSKPGGTHGHHTASAILAEEAFKAAGDKSRFSEQLRYVSTWQPKRLLWNTSWWFYGSEDFDKTGLISVDVGEYNPLLGKSYTEIAAEGRSMHKSQGFGATLERGSNIEYLKPILGGNNTENLFYDLNLSWSKVAGGKMVTDLINKALQKFNPEDPSTIVSDLVEIYKVISSLPDNQWKTTKLHEVKILIKASLGLYMEATASKQASAPGEFLEVSIETINRSAIPVTFSSLENLATESDTILNMQLANNSILKLKQGFRIPASIDYTQPYWIREEASVGMFSVNDQHLIGMPEDSAAMFLKANMKIMDQNFSFAIPIVYKRTDPVDGEVYQPFEITPPVYMNIDEDVYIFPNQEPKKINVLVTSSTENINGELRLTIPKGWEVRPANVPVAFGRSGGETTYTFEVTPPASPDEGFITAVLTTNGKEYNLSKHSIVYDHIPNQTLYPEAKAKIVKLDIEKKGQLVGYIMGAGDNIPKSLEQIGYNVEILNDDLITRQNLKKYDAVILGIRAYNTVERLKFYQPLLLEYVKNGGTMIVQYNTNSRLVTDELGPYPFSLSRDRVTVEDAKIKILNPQHPVLNFPNKITEKDFDNWVQERGLYFPDNWSKEYEALLSSHDPGETPKDGGLLIASYGEGYYIYTGYSWFRELPAGVPGAYRIFTNLISIGKNHL